LVAVGKKKKHIGEINLISRKIKIVLDQFDVGERSTKLLTSEGLGFKYDVTIVEITQ